MYWNSAYHLYTVIWDHEGMKSAFKGYEPQTIISSLREVLRSQTEEVPNRKKQLAATKTVDPVREAKLQTQLEQLNREREEEACGSYHDKRFSDNPEEKEALQRELASCPPSSQRYGRRRKCKRRNRRSVTFKHIEFC